MPRRSAADSPDTLKTIIEGAFALFGQYGYEGVSIDQIAKSAKLSKGAMYWHFSNKDELYIACLEKLHSLFDEYIFSPIQAEEKPSAAVMLFFRGLYQLLEDPRVKQGVGGYWLEANRGDFEAFNGVRKAFEQRTSEVVADIFRTGQAQGEFNFTLPPDLLAMAFMRLMEACILPLSRHSEEENQQMIQALVTTFMKAYQIQD